MSPNSKFEYLGKYLRIIFFFVFSENSIEGRRVTKLEQILLNGINIAMVIINCFIQLLMAFIYLQMVPGGEMPDA